MKYLILGANGLIGQQFVKLCENEGIDYIGTRYSRATGAMRSVNFQEPKLLLAFLDEVSPTVVVNCVNLAGGVNFCEENPELARTLHVEAVQVLADWCAQRDAVFVFFSSDYVFDGKNPPYKEDDETGPLNLYGKLKLESEIYIQKKLKRYIIARTTNVFGWDPDTPTPNFLMYLYQTLREGKPFKVPSFLYGNPTLAEDLVKAVQELIEKEYFGLYHIVGSGYINRCDWAMKFCEMAGLDKEKIVEVKEPPANMAPQRPLLSHLDTERVSKLIKTKLHGVDDGLRMLVAEMKGK
jgi:dTDP-4-dehydrorhamnose reductase